MQLINLIPIKNFITDLAKLKVSWISSRTVSALWEDPFNLDFEEDLLKELNTLPGLYDHSDVTLGLDLMEDPLLMTAPPPGSIQLILGFFIALSSPDSPSI